MTKISSLVELLGAGVDQANDLLPIVDMSETGAARNKKIKITQLLGLITDIVGLLDLKGSTDCSADPNYPAALKGDFYLVSVAGKIGGAAGVLVEAGDAYFATADNAGGTQAAVGGSWAVMQGNVLAGSVSDLDDLSDVDLAGLADGDTLVYDLGSGQFVTVPLPGGGAGGTVPDGGTTGQVLIKASGADQDTEWGRQGFVGARLKLTSDLATTNFLTTGEIPWQSADEDTASFFSVASTVTITIASPGVVTWTGHVLANGSVIVLSTTSALPTGLTAGTPYWIVNAASDTFQLAASPGGAAINTSGSQSGAHTATAAGRVVIPAAYNGRHANVQVKLRINLDTADTFKECSIKHFDSSGVAKNVSVKKIEAGSTTMYADMMMLATPLATDDQLSASLLQESDNSVTIVSGVSTGFVLDVT